MKTIGRSDNSRHRMQNSICGTFHFHSTYSHDGRSTLAEVVETLRDQGFSFCIMTEHFEDFSEATFTRYIAEAQELSRSGQFLLIPGLEIHLNGIDTIVFPAMDYQACVQFALGNKSAGKEMFKVVAHPSKYSDESVGRHLQNFELQGIEIWNQQADGSYLPPFGSIERLTPHLPRGGYHYLFGCDLHDSRLSVSNFIVLSDPVELQVNTVMDRIRRGEFVSVNKNTGVQYRNGSNRTELQEWLGTNSKRHFRRGQMLRRVRAVLKGGYRAMPRPVRRWSNNFKNWVRNKL